MSEHADVFELMSDQDKTNKSIISFRVKHGGEYLSHDELKSLYKRICLEGHRWMPKYELITIGQPVAYAAGSFLRLALGSFNVRKLIDRELDLRDDTQLLDTLRIILNDSK